MSMSCYSHAFVEGLISSFNIVEFAIADQIMPLSANGIPRIADLREFLDLNSGEYVVPAIQIELCNTNGPKC